MKKSKRGNVWLGAAGLVVNSKNEWLVVKKRYGGLHGKWSLPAGFVNADETIDQAAMREVKEETGIDCTLFGLVGFRSGVIREEVSDNMGIFLLKPVDEQQRIKAQLDELYEAAWRSPEELSADPDASVMLHEMADFLLDEGFEAIEDVDPGDVFGYSSYKLFFKK
ncbi:NUDIX domain-containing protein [Planococcus sp. 107-1]|uniref:NUDIX domain-containing protein n=1 Tax=Planococcus sp. 107-1 TaxID=2908840 RepID=UPI001F3C52CE|nr:NUDIX hydrolase [Planococcus sp. 107-1]UJF28006.1 NUDIX hydrolase [Planococcus sp. 107-1]